jgi:hypothetical protein
MFRDIFTCHCQDIFLFFQYIAAGPPIEHSHHCLELAELLFSPHDPIAPLPRHWFTPLPHSNFFVASLPPWTCLHISPTSFIGLVRGDSERKTAAGKRNARAAGPPPGYSLKEFGIRTHRVMHMYVHLIQCPNHLTYIHRVQCFLLTFFWVRRN